MTDNREDGVGADQTASAFIPKPWVIPAPKNNLQRIFGTSQVFMNSEEIKPKESGFTVPLKVREYYVRGKQCLEKKDWEMAVLFFSRALHLDSELVDFYVLRAEAYIQLCDFSSAAQNLRKAYYYQPDNTDFLKRLSLVLYLKGQCLFELCSFSEALKYFLQAAKLQPQRSCFRYRCMACYLALGRLENCLSYINKEMKQGLVSADLHVLRARLYNAFKKPNLCYRDLHKALLLDAQHPETKTLLKVLVSQSQQAREEAGILAVQGKLNYALQRINCAIENNPLDPSFFLFRGTMYRRMQDFDAAVEDFLKALDMVSEGHEETVKQAQRQLLLAYNDFALHCYKQGAYQEGVLLLNKALKDEHLEKGLYINRGDCFFQLGNLVFAEADYQQALALSPQDEGAKLRMGLLQEKLGFCEQKRRHFDKAETHFSMAIHHNPKKVQNYLFRAKTRQFLQNTFGARQDVATALLLNPKHPKLLPLLEKLFPGMSVEEVRKTKVCQLAQQQLRQKLEDSEQNSLPQSILGKLREQELEHQKVPDAEQQPELLPEAPEVNESTPQASRAEPRVPRKKEKKRRPAPKNKESSSNSYLDSTFSGPILAISTRTSPETSETSTVCWDYKSTSTTGISNSSVKAVQSSDMEEQNQSPKKTQGQSQTPNKSKAPPAQSQHPCKGPEAAQEPKQKHRSKGVQGSRQRFRKVRAVQDWGWRLIRGPPKRKILQDPGLSPDSKVSPSQSPGENEVTDEHTQRPIKIKVTYSCTVSPGKIEIAQSHSQNPGKPEVTQGYGSSLSKLETSQNHSQSDSKTQTTPEENSVPSKTEGTQDQSRNPNKTDATQGFSRSPSRPKVTRNQSPSPTKAKGHRSPSPTKAKGHRSPSPTKAKGHRSPSPTKAKGYRSPSPTKAKGNRSPSPSKSKVIQNQSWSPTKTKITRNQSPSPSKSRVTWSLSPTKSKGTRSRSPSPSKATNGNGQGQGPRTTEFKGHNRSRGKTKVARNLSRQ
ncbi:tetratricopeptide repeat protein 16 [Sorex araneus]|uniref:tetratricopeptide repeat protein 16 n=1 Tax=Sorex araneus TaxID=42254 RepID=UPI0024336D9C|nr:tetratricopeptide repeat protein 16 [Sorex araneus]